jgi:hypothetical protein
LRAVIAILSKVKTLATTFSLEKDLLRVWVDESGDVLLDVAVLIPGEADDEVLAFIDKAVSDPDLFNTVYDTVIWAIDLFDGDEAIDVRVATTAAELSPKAGVSPSIIVAAIQLLIFVVRFVRDWRK